MDASDSLLTLFGQCASLCSIFGTWEKCPNLPKNHEFCTLIVDQVIIAVWWLSTLAMWEALEMTCSIKETVYIPNIILFMQKEAMDMWVEMSLLVLLVGLFPLFGQSKESFVSGMKSSSLQKRHEHLRSFPLEKHKVS